MLIAMNMDPKKVAIDIWLGGDLPGFSGLGASAASSVAIARAIAQEFKLDLSDEKICYSLDDDIDNQIYTDPRQRRGSV